MAKTYFDELPKTVVQITKVFGLIVKPDKYWYDYKNNVIIRRCNLDFENKPYAILQGRMFQPILKSQLDRTTRFELNKVIDEFARLYKLRSIEFKVRR